MKKPIKYFAIVLGSSLALASCGSNKITDVDLDDNNPNEIEIASFDYDKFHIVRTYKNGKKDTIELSSDMISDYEKLKFYQPGSQTIDVNYMGATLKLDLNVKRHTFDLKLKPETFVYNGKSHKLEFDGYLPNDATIIYPYGDSFVDVGVHTVKAIISCPNYETITLTENLEITPATIDLSNIVYKDQEYTYDGNKKNIVEIENLPDNVSVSYLVNGKKDLEILDAGEYTITAIFKINDSAKNYIPIDNREVKYIVKKAVFNSSDLVLKNREVYYTGEEYEWKLANELPNWIEVTYENNKHTDIGIYYNVMVNLKIKNSNYELLDSNNKPCDELSIPFEVAIIPAE